MSTQKWNITLQVYRKKGTQQPHFDEFPLEVNPEEYVLDAIERVWAYHDRSLTFRHACHHSTCGACGMVVNGVEKLTCITPIKEVTSDGGTLRVEPMRNFPVISDLVVDMSDFLLRMEMVGQRQVLPVSEAGVISSLDKPDQEEESEVMRLSDCIECGLCMSACPIEATTPTYLGPAVLAGAQQNSLAGIINKPQLLALVDSEDGVWRCHSAFECTAVCPSYVDPGWRIMDLRKRVVKAKIQKLFGRG